MIKRIFGITIFCIAVIGIITASAAEEGADKEKGGENRKGIGFYFDQDLLTPALNEDRDYTMGVAIEFFWKSKPKFAGILDDALMMINRKFLRPKDDDKYRRSLIIGSVNFTPDDLANSSSIFNDRPYASLLYLGSKGVVAIKSRNNVLGTELQVGFLGLNIAKTVQTGIHSYNRKIYQRDEPVEPKGWNHQISDGGELTLKYRVSYGEQISQENRYWDLAYTADVSVGYQSNASLGMQARLGYINSEFWTLPYDPINRGNFLPSTGSRSELYFWAAYRARGVFYDALLQGQFRHSDVTFHSGDINRLIHEAGAGFTAAYKSMQFTFSRNFKSSELKGAASRSHFWGGVYFMFKWYHPITK